MEEFCGSIFWDNNITWNTTQPDFTPCFEKTILVWIPSLFLFLFLPLEFKFVRKSLHGTIPWNFKNISKIVGSVIILLCELALLIGNIVSEDEENIHGVDYLYPCLLLLAVGLQLGCVLAERKKGIQKSAYLFGFWLLLAICGLAPYRTHFRFIRDEIEDSASVGFLSYMFFYPTVLIMFVLNCFADDKPIFSYPVRGKNYSPEMDASCLNICLFYWLDRLIWQGYKNPITQDDLWDLPYRNTSKNVVEKWDQYWQKSIIEITKKKKEDPIGNKDLKIKVFPVLLKTFWRRLLFAAILKLIHDCLQFIPPQIISWLITFSEDLSQPSWRGYFYCVFLFVVIQLNSILAAQQYMMMYEIGLKIKTAVTSLVYRKALIISSAAKKESTVGEIVNLMAIDVQRFVDLMSYLNMMWSAPFQITVCLYFLWKLLGASAFVGLLVMILLVPINGYIGNLQKRLQITQMKEKDKRVKLMNEILNGIKVLKLYAWEPSFINQVIGIRSNEIDVLKKSAYLGSAVSFVFTTTPFLVSFFMFMTYVLSSMDHILTPDVVFVSLSLLNILRYPMTLVPVLIISLIQAGVSLQRLNKFMNSEELSPQAIDVIRKGEDDAIVIENGNFSWDVDLTLKDINLNVKNGSLVGVVGTVGSGKSSLCSAILGEMEKKQGRVFVQKSTAYVPQQAWIQNDTLEKNIIFCRKKDPLFYDKVIEACALKPDLNILPASDQTEIGEKGINLSGGQKQRVSLARAVYSQSDIIILDDPLSAVDSHVGKHIYEQVIGSEGLLKDKTRLLVTHSMSYIKKMDHILVLKDGCISEQGTFDELVANKGEFHEFLIQYLKEVDDPEELDEIIDDLEHTISSEILERQISHTSHADLDKSFGELVRRSSKSSLDSLNHENKQRFQTSLLKTEQPKIDKIIKDEKAEIGRVSFKVYQDYVKSIGAGSALLATLFYGSSQIFSACGNVLLSEWADNTNGSIPSVRDKYLAVYASFGVLQALTILVGFLLIARACLVGSKFLHNAMLQNIMRSPLSFFDVTPIGRIINRFAKDVDTMDVILPSVVRTFLLCLTAVIITIAVICYATPIFIVVVIPCFILYFFVQTLYVTTSRQLKRIESVTKSPVYSHFGESIQGAPTIRAYNLQEEFIRQSEFRVDQNQKSYYLNIASYRWLSIRLELIGNLLTFFAALFTVTSRGTISGGDVGLSISYAISVTGMLNYLVRMTSEVETNIVAVERLKEYTVTPQESPWEVPQNKPPKEWPEFGMIDFQNYSTRYRENLDLVVKQIDCRILPKEKIGIVGRTGAGKSSLTLALFRIIEPAGGTIFIDDVDISKIGLHDIRGKLTIIPQDPVLFSGSLRMNLDPFNAYPDEVIWDALEHAHLKSFVVEFKSKLHHEISEGGENLSVGQRQLVCLARALLRKTKVLVLDEATAAIDLETDDLIQETIRREFEDCTVITIAHRLNTIMDSSRVLVLDKGMIKEFDSPSRLLKLPTSLFYGMAKDAGLI